MSQHTQYDIASLRPAEGDDDWRAFREGTDFRMYRRLGALPDEAGGRSGVRFAVWAPNAARVSVIGDFNEWMDGATDLVRGDEGVWRGFASGVSHGSLYKYRIEDSRGLGLERPDPLARAGERPPADASRVWLGQYGWGDDAWTTLRCERMSVAAPWSIYELHLGSWRRDPARPGDLLSYRDFAATLPAYVEQLGFTHVALMPLAEHADYGSWGYGCDGFFRPTSRYGSPDDLRLLIDALHRHGIGVLLDWTPTTFTNHPRGLAQFDGTRLYECEKPPAAGADARCVMNLARGEVRSYVGSGAFFWLDEFHIDGLRIVGLDAARGGQADGESAKAFLATLNDAIHREYPDARMVADDRRRWSDCLRPVRNGGLGFDLAWDCGRVDDVLAYVEQDPHERRHHHQRIAREPASTARRRSVLPLSHEEVQPGGRSLVGRIPGDAWQRFATLRVLYGYLWTYPGRPLLFMGDEFGQGRSWNPAISLDWHLLDDAMHAGVHRWVGDLNRMLRERPALQGDDDGQEGFEWLAPDEAESGLVAFERRRRQAPPLMILCNFMPVARENVRLGVAANGTWREIINSDASLYGGSGAGNFGRVEAVPIAAHGRYESVVVTVPPLAMIALERAGSADSSKEDG